MKVVSADAKGEAKRQQQQQATNDDVAAGVQVTDALEVLKCNRKWSRVYLDIMFALTYFGLFFASIFSHLPATNETYMVGHSISATLVAAGSDIITPDSTIKFANIQSTSDIFDWLTDSFIPNAFVTTDYNGNPLQKDKRGRVATFNKILGGVMFQTTHAGTRACSGEHYLSVLYPTCNDLRKTTRSTNTLIIGFDTNASQATATINTLKERGDWLNSTTQMLEITVITYNGELKAYAVTYLSVSFHPGGSVELSSAITPMLTDPRTNTIAYALDVFVACLSTPKLVLAFVKMARLWKHRSIRRALHIIFELIQLCSILLFYVWLMLFVKDMEHFYNSLAFLVDTNVKFEGEPVEQERLAKFVNSIWPIRIRIGFLRGVAIVAVVMLKVELLKAFHSHPSLGVLTRTIARSLRRFASVFVVFVVVFVSFSASGTLLFGDRVENFSSLSRSFETCVNMLFGNFDYKVIENVYTASPRMFYWPYMVLVSLILLSMMLAIVIDAYTGVCAERDKILRWTSTMQVARTALLAVTEWRSKKFSLKQICCFNKQSRYSPSDKMKACSAMPTDEVVSWRYVRPSALILLLSGLVESRPDAGVKGSETTKPTELKELTAADLRRLFASAEISPTVAQNTIRFIREGVAAYTRSNIEGGDSNDAKQRESEKHVDLAEVQCDGLGTNKSSALVAEAASSSSANQATAHRVAVLVEQVEDIQRKLDLVLSKLAAEKEMSSTDSTD